MTNIETLIGQVKELSELEMTELTEQLREHCRVNDMSHLFDDPEGEIEELEDEVRELKEKVKHLKKKLSEIDALALEILNIAS